MVYERVLIHSLQLDPWFIRPKDVNTKENDEMRDEGETRNPHASFFSNGVQLVFIMNRSIEFLVRN